MFKAVLFDLDGVVLDTESQYTVFWKRIFQRYYPEDALLASKIKGQTLTQIFDSYFAGDKERQRVIEDELDAYERQLDFSYIKGFEKFVALVREAGLKTAIVTSSNQKKMASVYRSHPEFREYFDAILTSEDCLRSKPAPDCYLLAAERMGVSPAQSLVLEDSINGLKSGRASGAVVIGLSTTNSADVIAPLSDYVMADYAEIPSFSWLEQQVVSE